LGIPKTGRITTRHTPHAGQYGRVEAFAPYARPQCCINVEDTIRWGDPREFDDALTIGQSLTAPRTMAKESEVSLHFRELAAMLLAAVQLHVGYTSAERSLPGVWRFLTQRPGKTKGRKLLETLELMGKPRMSPRACIKPLPRSRMPLRRFRAIASWVVSGVRPFGP